MDVDRTMSEATEIAEDDPRRKRRFTFTIDYEGPDGRLVGEFTNTILNFNDRLEAGCRASRLRGALPISSVDAETLEMSQMLGWLALSMPSKDDRPKWAIWGKLYDVNLLRAIYDKAMEHEAIFRGPRADQGGNEEEG